MPTKEENAEAIREGKIYLGLELGSTRIKAVLLDESCHTLATGSHAWESVYEQGYWTYSLDAIWEGVRHCYAELAQQVQVQYGLHIRKVTAMGISAMMHGYLAFDKQGTLLTPFRTWRNATTQKAATELSARFAFNVPQRWSIAHLYQAILNRESHVKDVAQLTTLAGYIHWKLTGKKCMGIGDASGMFPLNAAGNGYDVEKMHIFAELPKVKAYRWQIADILPQPLCAGQAAGNLTAEGAHLLDPQGYLLAGALCAPPEGDAGTGMVSTHAVRPRTGNISAGTSAFSMNVLDAPLKKAHPDIDVVATPDGLPVAMVHANNCTSDFNAWANLFAEFAHRIDMPIDKEKLFCTLLTAAGEGTKDLRGMLSYPFLAAEPLARVAQGRPLFSRMPSSDFSLSNFMRTHLYAAFAPLAMGMETLKQEENIHPESMFVQGGLFKTPVVAQQALADALNLPITAMETAGEGGPWGMALLARYAALEHRPPLADFLDEIFKDTPSTTLAPDPAGVEGYAHFLTCFQEGLRIEKEAGRLQTMTEV